MCAETTVVMASSSWIAALAICPHVLVLPEYVLGRIVRQTRETSTGLLFQSEGHLSAHADLIDFPPERLVQFGLLKPLISRHNFIAEL